MYNQSVLFKKKRCEKRKWDVVHIYKNNKTFDKNDLQLSTEITFDSCVETTIIIYQIEAPIKLHNMSCSCREKSFLYPNSIVYITYRGFNVFDDSFSFYLLPFLFNRAIKEILVPKYPYLFIFSISLYSLIKIREKKNQGILFTFSKTTKHLINTCCNFKRS